VDKLEGSEAAKHRLRVVLETLQGDRTVEEACRELGLSESGFYKLRSRTLEGALQSLEPRRVGRPAKEVSPEQERVDALKAEVFQLKMDLQASRIREEIALVMPHLLKDKASKSKKKARRKKGRRRGAGGDTSAGRGGT
jgi:transposase-like protein